MGTRARGPIRRAMYRRSSLTMVRITIETGRLLRRILVGFRVRGDASDQSAQPSTDQGDFHAQGACPQLRHLA